MFRPKELTLLPHPFELPIAEVPVLVMELDLALHQQLPSKPLELAHRIL